MGLKRMLSRKQIKFLMAAVFNKKGALNSLGKRYDRVRAKGLAKRDLADKQATDYYKQYKLTKKYKSNKGRAINEKHFKDMFEAERRAYRASHRISKARGAYLKGEDKINKINRRAKQGAIFAGVGGATITTLHGKKRRSRRKRR